METAVFILTNDQKKFRLADYFSIFRKWIRKKAARLDRVYYGAEYCEKMLSTAEMVEDVFLRLKRRRLGFSLVTPVMVTDWGIQKLKHIFSRINKYKGIEVIVNDWGVLELLQEYGNLLPVFGRSMNKMKRDPRFNFKEFSKNQYWALRRSSLSNGAYVNFLKKKRIGSVEIDNVEQGIMMNFRKMGLKVHLCFPLVPIAYSKFCMFGSTHRDVKEFKIELPCRGECKDYFVSNRFMETRVTRALNIDMIGRGYYQVNYDVRSLNNFNRLVIIESYLEPKKSLTNL